MILDRRQARLLVPLVSAVALSLTGDSTLYAVLANQTAAAGLTLAAVGVMLGVNRLIRIPGNLVAGALTDRFPRRPLVLLGLLLGVLSTIACALVRGFWPWLAARLLWGAAWSLIYVGGYAMVLDWSTPADRGRMTGLYQMGDMLGLALSPLLGGLLTDTLGFRAALLIGAAISAVGLGLACVALPETKRPGEELQSPFWTGLRPGRLRARLGSWRGMDRRFGVAGYLYLVTFFVGGGVLMSTISLYLGKRWPAGVTLNGTAIGIASLAGAMLALRAGFGLLAGPLSGILSDRLGNRWPVVRGGLVLGMAGFLILALSTGVWAGPLGVILVSLCTGTLVTVVAALVGDWAVPTRQGLAVGALATAGDIGAAAGPLLAYPLAVVLDLRWVYLLCALALGSGLLVAWGQRSAG